MTISPAPVRVVTALALTAALLTAGLIAGVRPSRAARSATAAATRTVALRHNRFLPSTLRVARGTTVFWVWRDRGVLHNVRGAGLHSRTVTRGSFSHFFGRRGSFSYTCTIHPGMNGRVIVR